MKARARHGDPSTSTDAAKSVGELTESHGAVLLVLRARSSAAAPMLDEELVADYQRLYKSFRLPKQSSSGIRSRRAELTKAGRLLEGPKRMMSTGRRGRTWYPAPPQ